MPSSLNSSGFNVSVMPQVAAVDPRLYASDPSQASQGALQAFQVMGALQNLKDARAQAAEREATQQARIDQIKALSNLQVLAADRAKQTQAPTVANDLANLGLGTAKATGELAALPATQDLATLARTLQTKETQNKLDNYEGDLDIERNLKKANTAEAAAKAANYLAEAEKMRVAAKLSGQKEDKMLDAYHKNIGELAALVGKTPLQVEQLYNSGAVNKDGIPISTELAAAAEFLKKPEFWNNPYEKASPELINWIGDSSAAQRVLDAKMPEGLINRGNIDLTKRPVVHNQDGTISTVKSISIGTPQGEVLIPTIAPDGTQLSNEQAIELFHRTGQNLGTFSSPEAATAAAKLISKAQGKRFDEAPAEPDSGKASTGGNSTPTRFKIDASGNVTVPGAQAKEAPREQPQASTGSSVGNAAETAGVLSLAALANPALRARLTSAGQAAAKLGTRLWNGRSAAGQFTGKALKTLPKRSLAAFAEGGVGSVAGPVSALYAANQGLGSLLSDKETGDLTALQGIATAATQPSFDAQAREAKYDELSSRIQSIAQSTNLSDEQKSQELHKLINQRDLLWSMMQKD